MRDRCWPAAVRNFKNRSITALMAALILLGWFLIIIIGNLALPARAGNVGAVAPVKPVATKRVIIPEHSVRYRLAIEREAGSVFGLDASPARIAAQIHQESLFKPTAQSPYAQGLAQFTPSTAKWMAKVFPEECGSADPWDENWSIRCAVRYDAWLLNQIDAEPGCEAWAMAMSAYNGGIGWLQRDQKAARLAGKDPRRWFGHVETVSGRAAWAFKENRSYPRRILGVLEHAYIDAGWEGAPVCPRAT